MIGILIFSQIDILGRIDCLVLALLCHIQVYGRRRNSVEVPFSEANRLFSLNNPLHVERQKWML